MNKKHLFWAIPLVLMGIVAGAWLFSINGGFTMVVDSLPGYASINLDIPLLTVNTTSSRDSDEGRIEFLLNKDMNMSVSIEEIYQDLSGGLCLDIQNDCVTTYKVDNKPDVDAVLIDGEYVFLNALSQPRNLTLELTCQAYSCPQSRTANIILTEVK